MTKIILIVVEWLGLLTGLIVFSINERYTSVCVVLAVVVCLHMMIWDLERLRKKIQAEIMKPVDADTDNKINETIN